MIDDVLKDATRRMDKSVESARHEFTTVRTGRATPAPSRPCVPLQSICCMMPPTIPAYRKPTT